MRAQTGLPFLYIFIRFWTFLSILHSGLIFRQFVLFLLKALFLCSFTVANAISYLLHERLSNKIFFLSSARVMCNLYLKFLMSASDGQLRWCCKISELTERAVLAKTIWYQPPHSWGWGTFLLRNLLMLIYPLMSDIVFRDLFLSGAARECSSGFNNSWLLWLKHFGMPQYFAGWWATV